MKTRLSVFVVRNFNKSIWWMPRHQKTMKDAAGCDKPRRGPKQPLTRGCPNGETHLPLRQILFAEYIGV